MTHIAVIGSGPSGCYTADYLAKKLTHANIDIYDQQPTPFGLVQSGVAPDHLITKNIIKQLEKAFLRPNVRFVGNVTVFMDDHVPESTAGVLLNEIREHYDVIVFATGAHIDRTLGIDGENLCGVYPSGKLAAWYNGALIDPTDSAFTPSIGNTVGIVGNGNVALDIARLLAKDRHQLAHSEMPELCIDELTKSPTIGRNIYVIGRGQPYDAQFTPDMLKEIMELENVVCSYSQAIIPEEVPSSIPKEQQRNRQRNLDLLSRLSSSELPAKLKDSPTTHITFVFNTVASSIQGDQRANQLNLRTANASTNAQFSQLPIDTIITAIGFETGSELAPQTNEYYVGWCKHGSKGVIQSNRVDAVNVAREIVGVLESNPTSLKKGYNAIHRLLDLRQVRSFSFDDWRTIDQHERETAVGDKPREKIRSLAEMYALLDAKNTDKRRT